jgi:protein-S-isoprenylcysteine O-methyltransferase Ste14
LKRKLLLIVLGVASGTVAVTTGLAATPTNLLGWAMVFAGLGYCFGACLYLAFERQPALRAEAGDRSLWMLVPGGVGVIFLPVLEYLFFPLVSNPAVGWQIAGLTLVGLGLVLRVWVRLTLGRLYSGRLQVKTGHRVVTSGPYRFVRHPSYDGFLLEALGLVVGFSSLLGGLAWLFLLVPGFIYRIRVEEKLLVDEFGIEYRRYARRTRRLVPGIY